MNTKCNSSYKAACLLTGMLILAQPIYAATYHVLATGGDDANDGLSWTSALATIPAAMAKAGDQDAILLTNGIYNITAQVDLTNAVTFTSANGRRYTTIDAGNVADRRVFYMTHADASIDGITITRGNANSGSSPASQGGGVWMSAGRVQNCVISNNYALTSGPGVYMTGGTVSNCVVTKGSTQLSHSGGNGGGIYMSDGLVVDSEITDNNARRKATGVYMAGGELLRCRVADNSYAPYGYGAAVYLEGDCIARNCLIDGNLGGGYEGGGGLYVNHANARVENCTVVDNGTLGDGGGIKLLAGAVTNCIVYYNINTTTGADSDLYQSGGSVGHTCASDVSGGSGNITTDPAFTDRSGGDYSLVAGSSPCIDTGMNLAGVVDDLDGAFRPQDGDNDGTAIHDMGCYEAQDASSGPLRCSFSAPVTEADISLDAVFTVFVAGANTNGLYYWWDFDNNGDVDAQGADKGSVSHSYGPGFYSVKLTVSNELAEVASRTEVAYIKVYPAATYVATKGAHVSPYGTWANAATNIHAALDLVMAGGTVTVSNGEYGVTEQLSLDKAVTVQSVAGASRTVVKRTSGDTRIVNLSHSSAVLDGFTVSGGYISASGGSGGGVYMTDGYVRNCVISNNYALSYGGCVYMTGGTVSNCTVTKGATQNSHSGVNGGGIYMSGGLVVDSDIRENTCRRKGSGVYMAGGELLRCRVRDNTYAPYGYGAALYLEGDCVARNCLIVGNVGGSTDGGGGAYVNHASARVENCTVVDNETLGDGGGIKLLAGSVSNCIVYYNINTTTGADSDLYQSGGSVGHTCASDVSGGSGNITTDPAFTDRGGGDYSLVAGSSPCIDTGTNLAGVIDDIDGAARPQDGDNDGTAIHDMGCYEAQDASSGPLRCSFSAPVTEADLSLDAVFTVFVAGANTNGLYYWWDFDNDGGADDEGSHKRTVSHTYGPGSYSVKLTVSNELAEVASRTEVAYIKVYSAATYVATNGAHVSPYGTWADAATNIHAALDLVMAGGTVTVSNGEYGVTEQLSLDKAVTVQSVAGASRTVVKRTSGDTRIVNLSHSSAVLDGFTIANGYLSAVGGSGGGVYMTDGYVRNCVISNNYALSYGGCVYMTGGTVSNCVVVEGATASSKSGKHGGGIYMSGGLVMDSDIRENTCRRKGSGVYMAGGELLRCRVRDNTYAPYGSGAAVYLEGDCVARNCLIVGNEGGSYEGGGGLYVNHADARVENCTVVGNASLGDGGGIKLLNGGVTNCIVYYNAATNSGNDVYTSGGSIGHTCSPDLVHDPAGTGSITNAPQFTDAGSGYGLSHAPGDYHPITASPCLNAGVAQPWMATGLDLDRGPRVINGQVDMGAYETYFPPGGSVIILR